jgi:hypothetical protein
MAEKNLDDLKSEMTNCLNVVDIEKIKLDKVTMRVGNKIVQLAVVGDASSTSVDQEIRKEYSEKLTKKLAQIGDIINNKMSEVTAMVSQIKSEYDRKEKIINDRMRNMSPMPDVNLDMARKGMYVFKGDSGEVCYLIRGKYRPLMIDQKPLKPVQAKKLEADIFIMFNVKDGKNISMVSTRDINTLDYFDHYHQAKPDCWGKWMWPKDFKTPYDLFSIARTAEGVLENINTGSIANRNPRIYPKIDVLRKYIIDTDELKSELDGMKKGKKKSWMEMDELELERLAEGRMPEPEVAQPLPGEELRPQRREGTETWDTGR